MAFIMSDSDLHITPATLADAAAICELYNDYVVNTTCTLQEKPLEPVDFHATIQKSCASEARNNDSAAAADADNLPCLYFVAKRGGVLCGYCYADVMRSRCAYRYSFEESIYVARGATGRGVGRALMSRLLERVRETDIQNLVAVVTLPNPQSVAFHESFGFVHRGTLPATGKKFNQWWDVGFWQKQCKSEVE